SFDQIEELQGAAGNKDTFVFETGSSLDGAVDGGADGADTLLSHDQGSVWAVTGSGTGTSGLVHFSGFETLVYPDGAKVSFGPAPSSDPGTQLIYLETGGATGVTYN